MAKMLMQALIAPMFAHGRIEEVLMHDGQFRLQDPIQEFYDAFFGFHDGA
jgi:hypothetical protein